MRHAGGLDSNEVPPVRREHEFLLRRGEQIAGTLDAANFSGNVRAPYHLLRDVYSVDDHYD